MVKMRKKATVTMTDYEPCHSAGSRNFQFMVILKGGSNRISKDTTAHPRQTLWL